MDNKLCEVGFGFAAAVVGVICVVLMSVLAYLGYDKEAFDAISKHYAFVTFTPVGVFLGALVVAVKGFVFGYLFAWFYNHCPVHSKK